MSPVRSARRALATSIFLAGLLVIPALPASAQETATSAPAAATPPGVASSPAPGASIPAPSGASPAPAASPAAGDFVFYPLPASVAVIPPDVPTVSVEAESSDQLEIGQAIEYTLGHCGLWSPIDLDGSIWRATGGVKPDGSPIEEGDDAEIGELINATPGVFVIVDEERAHLTTVTGTILELVRAPGAVDFPLCM